MIESLSKAPKRQWRSRVALSLLSVLLLVLLWLSYHFLWLIQVDYQLYDRLIRLSGGDPPEDVIVVAIDEKSISEIGQWPWSRDYHGQLIELLIQGGVKLIAYDVVFSEQSYSDKAGDRRLQQALDLGVPVLLPVYIDQLQKGGQLIEVMPHPQFAEYAELGHVNTELGVDGVVRSAYLYQGVGDAYWKHFSLKAAEILQYPLQLPNNKRESLRAPFYRVAEHQYFVPFIGDAGTFQQLSFVDVITGRVPVSLFKDKVAFVGATALTLGDALQTPTTVRGEQMPGVEINANIFEAIRQHRLIKKIDPLFGMLLSALLLIVALAVVPRVSGPVALLITAGLCGSVFLGAYGILVCWSVWFPFASSVLAILLVYPLLSVIRIDQALRYFRKQFIVLSEQLEQSSKFGLISEPTAKSMEKVAELFSQVGISDCGVWRDGKSIFSLGNVNKTVVEAGEDSGNDPGEWHVLTIYHDDAMYKLALPALDVFTEKKSVEPFFLELLRVMEEPQLHKEQKSYDLLINNLEKVKRSQQQLSQARALFHSCLMSMGEGVVITDIFSEVLFSNRMADELLSLDKGVALWDVLSTMEMLKTNERWGTVFLDVIVNKNKQQIEVRTTLGRELLLDVELVSESSELQTAVDVEQKAEQQSTLHRLVVINVVDITRIKEAQRARSEAISFVSHDMRTPVVSLLSYMDKLSSEHLGDKEWNDAVVKVKHYANKSLYFSEQFLQLAKVDGDEPIQLYDMDLQNVVCNASDDIYNQAAEKNISVEVIEEGEDFWVRSNGDLIERVLTNLLTNAIKYCPERSAVTIRMEAFLDTVSISITDTGKGITASEQETMFKPFHRTYRSTGSSSGAGLGLRFVQVALGRLGSSLEYTTGEEGTSFTFTLTREPNNEMNRKTSVRQ